MEKIENANSFAELGLKPELCQIVKELGYEVPTPIQMKSIPILLAGRDLIGLAQTGTGKTAAFALPLLSKIKFGASSTQVLVLTPTRELAIQVAEAFQSYARKQKNFHVLPIYGGQSIVNQLRQLERRPQVIVGTPGRVMDHLRRKSLSLNALTALVVDEADEMLSMGFIDDIQWIIEQSPKDKQTTLFSATMPKAIRTIAQKYLRDPEEIVITQKSSEAPLIDQSHWMVSNTYKLDALTRILEVSEVDGVLIFVRTKTATVELADRLEARGYSAGPLNGDMSQDVRERTVERFKQGRLDVLVATDVAARGLDVDRISHVINYDVSFDIETYTHRIGRTGRAGRSGSAILFVSPRETGLLKSIERGIGRKIPPFKMPTKQDLINRRIGRFVTKVETTLQQGKLKIYDGVVKQLLEKTNAPVETIAAALCSLIHKESPLFVEEGPDTVLESFSSFEQERERGPRGRSPRGEGRGERPSGNGGRPQRRGDRPPAKGGKSGWAKKSGGSNKGKGGGRR